jgi:peptidoglycan/LPS O-acetylase OafA/YrhL
VGVLACVLAWAARIEVTPFLTWAGSLVYGVYLMHYGVHTLLNKVFHIKKGLSMFLLVTLISSILAAGARRTRLRAFV